MKTTTIEKLREISFFSTMSDFDLKQILEIITEHTYAAGQVIIEEKTDAERFFIIHHGKIEISKRFEDGEKAVLSIQSDGAFFGEMAILDEGRRSATVCAIQPTTVLEIQRSDFDSLLYKAPVLSYQILRELSTRLRESGALLISFLTQRNREMYRAYIDTMSRVIQTIENRNALTKGHNRRITELCIAIGRRMDLSEEEMLILELCSLLHDLGMLTIPEKVLEKTELLIQSEIDIIQTHTLESINMIGGIPMLQKVIPYIRHHHERYDGTGYPAGLAKEDIPKLSRILAVVDAYESMIRDRPYRERKTKEEAIAEMQKFACTQFDPEVVDICVKILESQEHTHEEHHLLQENNKLDRLDALAYHYQKDHDKGD